MTGRRQHDGAHFVRDELDLPYESDPGRPFARDHEHGRRLARTRVRHGLPPVQHGLSALGVDASKFPVVPRSTINGASQGRRQRHADEIDSSQAVQRRERAVARCVRTGNPTRCGSLPPVNAFWSLTLYNGKQAFVANPINRYAIGDRDKLSFNADGSLDVYVQHDSPGKEKEANWLPADAGAFNLMLRLYWPKEAVVKGVWTPPVVKKVD